MQKQITDTSGPAPDASDTYKPPHIVHIGEVNKLTGGCGSRFSDTGAGMSKGADPDDLRRD
jgi:hypothetical protein